MKKYIILMLMAFVSTVSLAQSTVKGTVVDANGEPIIGATVQVKGSAASGTITDLDGNFTLAGVPAKAQLVVSYIGYISETVSNLNNPKITLKEDSQQLEEVVVVGYGTQKKAHLTGSIETVPVDEITDLGSSDLAGSLHGLINGVTT